LFANKFELNIFASKIDSFRKDVTLRIVVVDDVDCVVVFLKRMLLIAPSRSNEPLFNINENVFNRKRIIEVFRQRLRSLDYDDHYASYFFRCDAITKVRNFGVLEIIIMLLNRWKFNVYLRYIEIDLNLIL